MSIASSRPLNAFTTFFLAVLFIGISGFMSAPLTGVLAFAAPPQGPPSPLPAFSLIENWEGATQLDAGTGSDLRDPVVTAVERLCRHYGLSFDRRSPLMANPSPLEWPRVFADETITPRRLRTDIESLMTGNGLAFRALATFGNEGTADSIMRAVSLGVPVLLNVPEAAIIYGYDRREPDPWWWIQHPDGMEIVFESERVASLMYWADDAASNLAWAVIGADTIQTSQRNDEREAGYEWLRTVIESVRRDVSRGIAPYPLSLRAFRDRIGTSVDVPELIEPVHESDPLGVRRARNARNHLIGLLEWLSQTTTDTLESESLRLALYYYYNAMQSLEQLDTLLYDAQPGAVSAARYEANWRNDVRKVEILARIEDLLEWEKQAAGEIGEAVSVVIGAKKKKK